MMTLAETAPTPTNPPLRETHTLCFPLLTGGYEGLVGIELNCKAWEWVRHRWNMEKQEAMEFRQLFPWERYLNADALIDVFRIWMGHRSRLRQHSGMVGHGGVGRGHVTVTWEKYVGGL